MLSTVANVLPVYYNKIQILKCLAKFNFLHIYLLEMFVVDARIAFRINILTITGAGSKEFEN